MATPYTPVSPDGSYRFVANLDSFAGNSGSGVFDSSGKMVGILVAGAADFVVNSTTGCVSVNTWYACYHHTHTHTHIRTQHFTSHVENTISKSKPNSIMMEKVL